MNKLIKFSLFLYVLTLLFMGCENVTDTQDQEPEPIEEVELLAPLNKATDQSTDINLKWKKIRGAKDYKIQIAHSDSFSSLLTDTLITGTSYDAQSLEFETTYYWRVLPIKKNQTGPWSDIWSFSTGQKNAEIISTELVSPENNAEFDSTKITFEWVAVDESEYYQYQLSDKDQFEETIHDSVVTATTLEIAQLQRDQDYFWRVLPVSSSKAGKWSDTLSFKIKSAPVPDTLQVTLVSPENNAENIPINTKLKWNGAGENIEYQVQLSANNNFSEPLLDKRLSSTSYELSDLDHQTKYYWRVLTISEKEDIWSDTWAFETESEPEPTPVVDLISPSDNQTDVSTDPLFEWHDESGYEKYQIQIHTNSTFSNPLIDETINSSEYQATGLENEETYYWRVQVATEDDTAWSATRAFTTEAAETSPPPSNDGFVKIQNGDFVLNGETFRFAGTNAYYLPNYEKINTGVVDRALDLFEETGVNVVRMWAFYDGYDCGYSAQDASENVIQTSPGVYSEEALKDLDRVIAKGKERGIRFIMPFVNFWDQLGGICQYNTWAGASNPSTNMEFFMNNDQTQKWFKDYIKMLLNRVNTVTGVAYKDEPAIFAWQIINEGRNRGADPQILRDWYQEIAQYIKSIDSNHLLSTGEEGFDDGTPSEYSEEEYSNTYALRANEGTSYILNTAIPEIDFGNAHWYPADYGFGSSQSNMLQAQNAWFSDHQRIAENYGKPFIVGEYGYAGWGNETVEQIYNELYDLAETIELDGNMIWQLVADGTKCWEFGGNICYPGGRTDEDLYIPFKQHVSTMRASQ